MDTNRLSSIVLSFGVLAPLAAAGITTGCTSDFTGCEASRSCGAAAGDAGAGGSSGKGGSAAGGSSTGGSSGRGGSAGKSSSEGGEGGEATAGKGGSAGRGGTAGAADSGAGGKGGTGGSAGRVQTGTSGEGGSGEDPEPEPEPADTTRPTVLSVTPADGAIGVPGDAVITITFSEPMDRLTTQAAYQSGRLPGAGVTYRWSTNDSVLTLTPNDDLRYAEGGPSVPALEYALELTDTAKDLAGNRLVDHAWSFKTLRRVSQMLVANTDDTVRQWHSDTRNRACSAAGAGAWAGDNDKNQGSFLAMEFNLAEVPDGVVGWEQAAFASTYIAHHSYPGAGLGDLRLAWLDTTDLTTVSWTTRAVDLIGVMGDTYEEGAHGDIVETVESVYAKRATSSTSSSPLRLRLAFQRPTDVDGREDSIVYACKFDLGLQYLIP